MLKASDVLDILGVTLVSKMTFDKHLRSVSRAASQNLGILGDYILRNSWRVLPDSMIDCFLEDAFGVLSCRFWSTVLQCGAQLEIYTLNNWIV